MLVCSRSNLVRFSLFRSHHVGFSVLAYPFPRSGVIFCYGFPVSSHVKGGKKVKQETWGQLMCLGESRVKVERYGRKYAGDQRPRQFPWAGVKYSPVVWVVPRPSEYDPLTRNLLGARATLDMTNTNKATLANMLGKSVGVLNIAHLIGIQVWHPSLFLLQPVHWLVPSPSDLHLSCRYCCWARKKVLAC